MLKHLVDQNRSYRAFDESRPITAQDMRALVDLARHVASGMNKQPLRYRIVSDPVEREKMLNNTRYAGALSILASVLAPFFCPGLWRHDRVLLFSVLFVGGLNLIAMSILGSYVGKIFMESKKRPIYVARAVLSNEQKAEGDDQKQ